MKKTRIIETPAKTFVREASSKEVSEVFCDICSLEIVKGQRYNNCAICGRDICSRSKNGFGTGLTCLVPDPDESGDYPDRYCTICAELLIPARGEMRERHYAEEEELELTVKQKSLATTRKEENVEG